MGRNRTSLIALLTAAVFIGTGLMAANAQENRLQSQTTTEVSIDYPGFLELCC